jgi:hypothetical protein
VIGQETTRVAKLEVRHTKCKTELQSMDCDEFGEFIFFCPVCRVDVDTKNREVKEIPDVPKILRTDDWRS